MSYVLHGLLITLHSYCATEKPRQRWRDQGKKEDSLPAFLVPSACGSCFLRPAPLGPSLHSGAAGDGTATSAALVTRQTPTPARWLLQ